MSDNILSCIKRRHVGMSLMCLDEDSVKDEISRLQGELEGIKMRANNMAFELTRFPAPRILVSVILEMLEVVQETPNES